MITGVLLAGGKSERMGRDKLGLEVYGQSLLMRSIHCLAECCDEVLVIGREVAVSAPVPVRSAHDVMPGNGSLGGLLTGLELARGDRCLVVAGDMPFLNARLLGHLADQLADFDGVVPMIDGLVEPLHACYSVRCAGPIRRQLAAGRRQIIGFFDEVRLRFVERAELERFDPLLLSFVNVNTPGELAEAAEMPARGLAYTPQGQRLRLGPGGGRRADRS